MDKVITAVSLAQILEGDAPLTTDFFGKKSPGTNENISARFGFRMSQRCYTGMVGGHRIQDSHGLRGDPGGVGRAARGWRESWATGRLLSDEALCRPFLRSDISRPASHSTERAFRKAFAWCLLQPRQGALQPDDPKLSILRGETAPVV